MAIKNNKISAILEEQIPDFIREDHDNFVQFLKSYYEFLESESPPTKLPLIVNNPFPTIYKPNNNPYGGQFQIGETIEQKANSEDSTEVTASAKVFAWSGDATAQTAIITSFGGTSKTFIKEVEIVGVKSGVKFFPVNKTESLKAGSTRASLDLLDTKDIDETLDDYVQYIKNEFAVNLPLTLHEDTDTRKVLKNIRDFYKARGTENSFKFLFRLLYGEDSSIYLPETDMLRASDANWKNVVVIRVKLPVTGISSDFAGRKIKGETSLATAIVEKSIEIIYAGARFVELELSNKLGTFVAGEFINTDNVGDGTIVRSEVLGLINNIKITDSGSNYHVGDRVVVNSASDNPQAKGAVVEVLTTNATSGAITSMKIVDPGYSYTSVPILDMTAPHNADAGAARFAAGPLETIFYNDFSQYTGANSFFTESDNRGASSNVGPSTNHPYDDLAYTEFRGVSNPADVTANSIMNFVTVPGVDEGLKGYWKMNSYSPKDVTINTADATANDSNDPVANNTFKGPRVGDITFVADPNYGSMLNVLKNYVNYSYTNAMSVPDRTGANTYLSTGWTGFQPVVYDESGHGHHAYLAVGGGAKRSATSTINVRSEAAFANVGVLGAGSNSLGTFGEGGLVLMPHDDIRNANTQSWVFWYNPLVHDEYAAKAGWQSSRRIITRDRSQHWSICANGGYLSSGMGTTERDDIIFQFVGAQFDNGNIVTDVKLANSSGYFPGGPGQINDAAGEGGILKLNTWNMIAITLDYNDQGAGRGVGNVYVFNTDDGLVVANGFTFSVTKDANTTLPTGWEVTPSAPLYEYLAQGRAVVLGENCESANGDTFSGESDLAAQGQYDEVRYYDKALSWNQIEHLFYNPGGRFDKTLSGDWKALNQGTNFYSDTNPVEVTFPTTLGNVGKYLRVGDGDTTTLDDGLHIITNKNIPFDPTVRYKMSANAKDGSASTASNTSIGIIGFSNTGIDLIGTLGEPSWDKLYSIVQSPGGDPVESGSLGDGWATYTAVYGGNTTHLGTHSATAYLPLLPAANGHGGNTEQSSAGHGTPKQEFKWANPVRLFGSEAAATQQGTGNTTFIRPVMFINSLGQDDITLIDYIKIEQQKDATLTAEIGTEFKQAGEYLDDSGKIGTSPTTRWRPKFIQDDKFYQIYSYVIKSGFSIGTYKELVKKLVHPAGLIMFGQVEIQTFVSAAMRAFDDTLLGDIVDLFRIYYMGAESTLLSEYADVPISGRGVGYHTQFGLDIVGEADFDLDAAHGVTPHGAGKNTPGSPGWIAWDQSPLTSPYANSHYYSPLEGANVWPYDGVDLGYPPYATSNAYTTVTDDSLIWNIKGWRTLLVSPFENENFGALFAHSTISTTTSGTDPSLAGQGQYGWEEASTKYGTSDSLDTSDIKYGITAPLDIDGRAHRYVRMKIRRIGPGGYGADSWLGVCQPTTNPSSGSGGSHWRPTLGLTPTQWNAGTSVPTMPLSPKMTNRSNFYASANTAQPSTLINSADVLPNSKSPWHILEWDMWELGQTDPHLIGGFIYPNDGGKNMWKDANPTTGVSPQDDGSGRRIGAMSFQLCYEPDNKPVGEKFEIAWIQVDNGDGWQRGSYAIPVGYANTWTSEADDNDTGTGTGGIPYRIRASESTDFSNQTVGDFSVTVAPAATTPSEITRGAPVLYVHSDKSIIKAGMIDQISDANGAIFRVSANTANNLDWIVTEVIDSEKFLRTAPGSPALGDYVGSDLTANGRFSGPVILDTDVHDNLYVGYVYEDHTGGYPRFGSSTDSKPLMLFRLTPTANVQTDMSELADPHNLRSVGSTSPARGRSNTYSAEQILWGNTGGTDGVGVMVGGDDLYGLSDNEWAASEIGGGSGSFVDFSTDDLGSLYVVGSGSQNIIKILPAANTSYANGVTRLSHDIVGQVRGRRVFELANPTTLDANNDVLGNWRPTNIIPGPKDSLFVACDTGYDPTNRGANSVYCYHVVTTQNVATGIHYTKNVYPVFANTSGFTAWPVTDYVTQTNVDGMSQSCAGMVLDHEEPPNLYYMSANTMYRIKPKGYSYQMGDTEIEQVFPDNYFRDTLNYHGGSSSSYYNYLGFSRHSIGFSSVHSYLYYQNNYQQLQVDSRNRIYFGGMANLYCYSRGSNTELLPLYNQSNTEFSTLQVVVNTAMYTSNVNFGYGSQTASIDSFVLGAKTSNSAFTGGDPGNPSTGANNFSEGVYITMHDGQSRLYNIENLPILVPPKSLTATIRNNGVPLTGGDFGGMIGYKFKSSSELIVNVLGIWDGPNSAGGTPGTGLEEGTEIGIWDVGTSLLVGETTIASGTSGFLFGEFRYGAIEQGAITLSADTEYMVAALYTNGGNAFLNGTNSFLPNEGITGEGSRFESIGSVVIGTTPIEQPTQISGAGDSNFHWIGPNVSFMDLRENGRRLITIYPNANGSFVESEGGQLAMTIMDENPAANTKYEVDGTGGLNKFRGIGPGKVVLRPEKI